jgi:hypothetical protein
MSKEMTMALDGSFVVAFDLQARREPWRVQLVEGARRLGPSDCFLRPSGVVLAIAGGSGEEAGAVMLDGQTGAKKWQRFPIERRRGGGKGAGRESLDSSAFVRILGADESNDFLLTAEANSVNVVDGANGTVLAAIYVSPGNEAGAPRIYWIPAAAYVVASGIARIARRERRLTWQQRFITYAYRGPARHRIGPTPGIHGRYGCGKCHKWKGEG